MKIAFSVVTLAIAIALMAVLIYTKVEYLDSWEIEPTEAQLTRAKTELSVEQLEGFYLISIRNSNASLKDLLGVMDALFDVTIGLLVLLLIVNIRWAKFLYKSHAKANPESH